MEERTELSTLKGKKIFNVVSVDTPRGTKYLFTDGRGNVLFQVKPDALFDADGMWFEDDVDSVGWKNG